MIHLEPFSQHGASSLNPFQIKFEIVVLSVSGGFVVMPPQRRLRNAFLLNSLTLVLFAALIQAQAPKNSGTNDCFFRSIQTVSFVKNAKRITLTTNDS